MLLKRQMVLFPEIFDRSEGPSWQVVLAFFF
jgi:hypothetical protein